MMCLSFDNFSTNDKVVRRLKERIGQLLHVRCRTHIINLIVQEEVGIANATTKIRDSLKYVRMSPTRLQNFEV